MVATAARRLEARAHPALEVRNPGCSLMLPAVHRGDGVAEIYPLRAVASGRYIFSA
jgi:hypothetical protein